MTKTPVKLTFEEYLTYDDGTDNRYELEDGVLIPMTPASPIHSDIIEFLYDTFKAEVKRLGLDWKVKQGDVGVRTQINRSRQPDIAIIQGEDWRRLRQFKKSAILEVPALLVVEVVSPGEDNENRDYVKKMTEYAEFGISEYWIIDPLTEQVIINFLKNGSYQNTIFTGQQRIISQLFPELNLTVEQIFIAE
ncbi:Uma2 family endonuclease [Planktothrix mougeotii]|uniref:Uma2 family endonuclease n=1 Tax=Planktothrix mougeotii LEGE 06226 TaxID=1828728 RepID=A0ABR9U920_9CYAN|nr:Uma2 family endonuclease [Planktothrix mougeotii]MBE9142691.1 Uma2 family endonuclease [Planktothrix mougeotii LEGE 06226]